MWPVITACYTGIRKKIMANRGTISKLVFLILVEVLFLFIYLFYTFLVGAATKIPLLSEYRNRNRNGNSFIRVTDKIKRIRFLPYLPPPTPDDQRRWCDCCRLMVGRYYGRPESKSCSVLVIGNSVWRSLWRLSRATSLESCVSTCVGSRRLAGNPQQ